VSLPRLTEILETILNSVTGRLKAEIDVDSVTATNVTIRDASDANAKVTVEDNAFLAKIVGEDMGNTGSVEKVTLIKNQKHNQVAIMTDNAMFITTYTAELTGNQAAVTIITPASGKKLCVRNVYTAVDGDAGTIALDFATSTKIVHRHYSSGAGERIAGAGGHVLGAIDEVLTLNATTLGSSKLFIRVDYIEHE